MFEHSHIAGIVHKWSDAYNLKPEVVAAMIVQESSGNPVAAREEPGFYNRYIKDKPLNGYVPTKVTLPSEKRLRSFSFGLMQLMGNTARELGLKNEFLFVLFDPDINISLGCKLLKQLLDKQPLHLGEMERYRKALLAYNGGGDPDYPDKVFGRIQKKEHLLFLKVTT